MATITRQNVIEKLGIDESNLNDKNTNEVIDKVLSIANILENVDFAFKEDVMENRVNAGKIIASVHNVVFWEE